MAKGRMLNVSVSASKKMDNLQSDTARLLATWTIAHLDFNGVFYADPTMVRSRVFPRRSDSLEDIENYLQDMERVGLIVLFEADGERWQYWPGFADNQPGLRRERERSDYPLPPTTRQVDDKMPADCPRDDAEMSAENNLTKSNLTELQLQDNAEADIVVVVPDEGLKAVVGAWQDSAGLLSATLRDHLIQLTDEFGHDWVKDAILEATRHQGRPSIAYIEGILRNWRTKGKNRDSPGNGQPAARIEEWRSMGYKV